MFPDLALGHITESHGITLIIGLSSVALLLFPRLGLGDQLRRWGAPERLITPITKAAPLVVVVLGTLLVGGARLHETAGVKIVGQVPSGMPSLTLPVIDMDVWAGLVPAALAISFVGYTQSIAMAKALASKRGKRVGVNQELVALGVANLGAAFTGGYPVTGGFSRSAVNLSAGANTPLASLVTAALMGLVVLFMTPLFFFLPKAVLAAIILVALFSVIDLSAFRHIWRFSKADAASMAVTFLAVLILGVQSGILVGIGTAIALLVWRTSHPHVAIVGRLGEGEAFRNVERHAVMTCSHVVAVRVDESLYFANASFLHDMLLRIVASQPQVEHLVLDGAAVNYIDASALKTLEALVHDLRNAGVTLYLSSIKGPVLDRLRAVGFIDTFGAHRVFLSTHDAFRALDCN
jgi:SulP family sulfate permease